MLCRCFPPFPGESLGFNSLRLHNETPGESRGFSGFVGHRVLHPVPRLVGPNAGASDLGLFVFALGASRPCSA